MPLPPFDIGNTTSIYELWINKSDNLPFKERREMSHDISVSTCSNLQINKLNIRDFNINDYFPKDYETVKYSDLHKKSGDSPSHPDSQAKSSGMDIRKYRWTVFITCQLQKQSHTNQFHRHWLWRLPGSCTFSEKVKRVIQQRGV